MDRRNFLTNTFYLSAAGIMSYPGLGEYSRLLNKIGIQFFSLPKLLQDDLDASLKMLAGMGYKEVELYGPYPFSSPVAVRRWQAITPSLGFSGSGYFGRTAREMRSLLDMHGLNSPSMHTDLDSLQNDMGKMSEDAHVLGHEFVILPAVPEEQRKTLDDYKRMAEIFNKIGQSAKSNGIKFGYHNHGYGLKEVDGQIPLIVMLDATDPALVYLEMDLFWTVAGGADPLWLLDKYKQRYRLIHVKDMSRKVHFSGDGGQPSQWIELFPYMTTAGNGVLDLKTILYKAKQAGVTHFIVEQDTVASPEITLKKSFDYLSGL